VTAESTTRRARPTATRLLVAALGVHLLFTVVHGLAHAGIPVPVRDWQNAFAVGVILVAPLVAAGLVLSGRGRVGAALAFLSGFAALAFEGLFHFVVANPDHVGAVEAGQTVFAATAILTVGGDLLLVVVAGWCLWRWRETETRTARTTVG